MAKLSRTAIRKIWEAYVSAYLKAKKFGSQASPELPQCKAEIDKIPEQDILAAIQPTDAEQLKFKKTHLLGLLIEYRVQRAIALQPDVDDLWQLVLPIVDTAEDLPPEQVSLPPLELDPMKYAAIQTRGGYHLYEKPYEPKIRRLVLELRKDLGDDDLQKLVAKAMLKQKPARFTSNFNQLVSRYLDGFMPDQKPSPPPTSMFSGLLGGKKNASPAKKLEVLPMDDLLERYDLWQSEPIEALHEFERSMMGYIEVFKRICKLKPDEIKTLLERAYKSWHYRISKTLKP